MPTWKKNKMKGSSRRTSKNLSMDEKMNHQIHPGSKVNSDMDKVVLQVEKLKDRDYPQHPTVKKYFQVAYKEVKSVDELLKAGMFNYEGFKNELERLSRKLGSMTFNESTFVYGPLKTEIPNLLMQVKSNVIRRMNDDYQSSVNPRW